MEKIVENDKSSVVQRNYNLDLLKIMACLAVVCMHTIHNTISSVNLAICYTCTFAIPIFFASSGFILFNRKSVTYEYSFKKAFHIIRIVFIWSLLVESLILVAKLFLGKDLSFFTYLERITYEPFIQKGTMPHFWFLGALILVYLLLPILHMFIKNSLKKWLFIWLTFVAICVGIQIVSLHIGRPIQKEVVQTFRLWTWNQYFLAGGVYLTLYLC